MSQDEIVIVIEKEEIDVVIDNEVGTELIVDSVTNVEIEVVDNTMVQDLVIESPEVDLVVEKLEDLILTPETITDIEVIFASNIGPPGPPGSPGPPGGSSGSTHIFTQGSPTNVWVVLHNLGWYPSVTVVDTGGSVVEPDVHYDSEDQLTIKFGSPTTGKAYLNPGQPGDGSTPGLESQSYIYTQDVAALVWTINHNLMRYPSVTVSDLANNIVIADAKYLSLNVVQITFTACPPAGRKAVSGVERRPNANSRKCARLCQV